MLHLLCFICITVALLVFAGCSGTAESKHPGVYRGGQDYDTAVHAQDVGSR